MAASPTRRARTSAESSPRAGTAAATRSLSPARSSPCSSARRIRCFPSSIPLESWLGPRCARRFADWSGRQAPGASASDTLAAMYGRAFFDLLLQFAQRVTALSGLALADALLQYTNL